MRLQKKIVKGANDKFKQFVYNQKYNNINWWNEVSSANLKVNQLINWSTADQQ